MVSHALNSQRIDATQRVKKTTSVTAVSLHSAGYHKRTTLSWAPLSLQTYSAHSSSRDSFPRLPDKDTTFAEPERNPNMEGFATIDPNTSSSEVLKEALYGGYTRFELELEFVQSLSNPYYLNHLASQKLLQDPTFIAYLKYLQYFTTPEYTKYLLYPGPTLKALELLQQERFRLDILSPDVVERLVQSGLLAAFGER